MKLSIVTTLYKSAGHLREFYDRISRAAHQLTDDYEIVLVNDGSPDDSLEIASELYERDARITVIDLSRNFGQHPAIMAGLAAARGERVFLIDCDLEEPPELLPRFWEVLHDAENLDVVYGYQQQRRGGWFERLSGTAFSWILGRLSELRLPDNVTFTRLMTRRYVQAVLQFRESELYVPGIMAIAGFQQQAIPVQKLSASPTTYTFARKIRLTLNAVTSFSVAPLHAIFFTGMFISVAAMIYSIYLVIRKLQFGQRIELGWTSLVVSIWFFGGLQIMFMGILGIYLSKIYLETKRRPRAVVRAVLRRQREASAFSDHDPDESLSDQSDRPISTP